MTGRVIGTFRIIDKLGEGAMGKVYRALDTMVEREVAMKALKVEGTPTPELVERFRTEAVTLARLNHPSIAQLYTFFRDGNEFYMVMEYIAGQNLQERIERGGAINWREAFYLIRLVLEGLGHAHSQGILHRDIKPANIMLPVGGGVKITDFGIAQMVGASRMTMEGRVIGTLEYLAPERIQGATGDPRSDLYAVGVVLYEMLTGKLPFSATSEYDLLIAQVQKPPLAPSKQGVALPAAVESVLMKALEKKPEHRYPNAAAFSDALMQVMRNEEPVPAPSVKTAAPIRQAITQFERASSSLGPKGKKNLLIGAGAGVVVFAAAILGVRLMKSPEPDPWKVNPTPAPSQPAIPEPQAPSTPIVGLDPAPVSIPYNPVTPAPAGPPPQPAEQQPSAPKPGKPAPIATTPPPPQTTPAATRPAPDRNAVLDALNRTDGPAPGAAGTFPIQLVGLQSSLSLGAPALLNDIREAVVRRGVNFMLTPGSSSALQAVGADRALLDAVSAQYRGPKDAPASFVPAPAAPPVAAAPEAELPKVTSLKEVRTIYVERMPDRFDEIIGTAITQELGGRLKVVKSPNADSVLRIRVEERKGGTVSRAGRMLGIQDKVHTTALLYGRNYKNALWSHEVGDKKPILGAFRDKDLERVAARIARELAGALQ